jgi:hypothetical protein
MVREMPEHVQSRLYTRLGVDPEDTAILRSFLDRPRTNGHTLKGSNLVNYHGHSRNQTRTHIRNIPALRTAFTRHLHILNKIPTDFTFDDVYTISNRISINGKWWNKGTQCEYTTVTEENKNDDTSASVGIVKCFHIVTYRRKPRHAGSVNIEQRAVFLCIDEYAPQPLIIDSLYQCPSVPTTTPVMVHVDFLLKFLTRVSARKRFRDGENPSWNSSYNLIPVSNAFVE